MITYTEALKRSRKNRNRKWVIENNESRKILTGLTLFVGRPGMGLTTSTVQLLCESINTVKMNVLYLTLAETDFDIAKRVKLDSQLGQFYIENQVYKASEILKLVEDLENGFSLITIDYFQLIDFDIPYQRFVKELDNSGNNKGISIVLLYQLGRSVEERGGDKVPKIQDLNDYPVLKKVDSIFYLYRPYYYGITEDENGEDVRDKVILGSFDNHEVIHISR